MKRILFYLSAITVVSVAWAQENPLVKSSVGDWAKYLVTTKNETVPLMSSKDQPKWRAISIATTEFVRIDAYIMFSGRRSGAGGSLSYFKDRFEPVPGLVKSAKVEVISNTKETLTVKGKQYNCTKIVRKIDQPLDEANVVSSWLGTSTIWVCNELPLRLAKMENVYQTKLSKSDKGDKISELWILDDFGFKNWK
jgi:hypothetical protein